MTAVAFGIRVDTTVALRAFQRAPELMTSRARQLIEGAAIDVQRAMIQRATMNVGATGDYRRSIQYRFTPGLLQAEIFPSASYADDLERGTGPHWVSVSPGSSLRRWAQMKGINPYAVQNSIAKRGTRPHPIVGDTYEVMAPRVQSDIARGLAAAVSEIDSGR
jgi:hypothetical protein